MKNPSLNTKVRMLPQFPRTLHIPWKPNTQRDDLVANEAEASIIFNRPRVSVEEKIDGSNCGMGLDDGNPAIRNHNHILHKGLSSKTPAKKQFANVWNWWHENKHLFLALQEQGPYTVFGEWCVAQHGMEYEFLPSWFIAHTVYNYESSNWIDTEVARRILNECGFSMVPLLHWGPIESYEQLESFCNAKSSFSSSPCEGVYVKVCDGKHIVERFKMIRQGFEQGSLWSDTELKKNGILK